MPKLRDFLSSISCIPFMHMCLVKCYCTDFRFSILDFLSHNCSAIGRRDIRTLELYNFYERALDLAKLRRNFGEYSTNICLNATLLLNLKCYLMCASLHNSSSENAPCSRFLALPCIFNIREELNVRHQSFYCTTVHYIRPSICKVLNSNIQIQYNSPSPSKHDS